MSDKNQEAVILSAVRTPSGSFQGGFNSLTAVDLGACVVKAAVQRASIPNPSDIKEVIMGNVVSAGLGQNPARQAATISARSQNQCRGGRHVNRCRTCDQG